MLQISLFVCLSTVSINFIFTFHSHRQKNNEFKNYNVFLALVIVFLICIESSYKTVNDLHIFANVLVKILNK